MGILKCDAIINGLNDSTCSSKLNTKLTACERKAYANFLTLSGQERQSIADKVQAGVEVEPDEKIGYDAYLKMFKH